VRHYPPRSRDRKWRGTTGGSTRAWRKQRERVLERDGHRCTFVDLATGERCTMAAPARLELHHLFAGYGIDAPDEALATVCTKHNPRGAA
jgi:hypothetical protein